MQDLAKQLKAQLEQAQKAKDAAPRSQGPKDTATKVKDKEEENVVVLTRTGRDGMVRPLPEQEFDGEGGGRRRRRKKKNVSQCCLPGTPGSCRFCIWSSNFPEKYASEPLAQITSCCPASG